MTVQLTVRQVREEIYRASGSTGVGDPTTTQLGTIFHDCFAKLFGREASLNWRAAIESADSDLAAWNEAIRSHLYQKLFGPLLSRHAASLQGTTPQILSTWLAVQSLAKWSADLLWHYTDQGRHFEPSGDGAYSAAFVTCETALHCTLRDPNWTSPVELNGIADAIYRIPGREPWCVLELKTGRTSPEADLAQVCLYHLMLSESTDATIPSAMAMLSFTPDCDEQLFGGDKLGEAQVKLKSLIGRLAGVVKSPNAKQKGRTPKSDGGGKKSPIVPNSVPTLPDDLKRLGEDLLAALQEYAGDVTLSGNPIVGPTFYRFVLNLGRGVRLNRVLQHDKEVQLRMSLTSTPIIRVDAGRLVVDIARPDRETVRFGDIRSQLPEVTAGGNAKMPVGVDLDGKLRTCDLSTPCNAHVLVAGTTGSGKSAWMRSAIAGLVATNTPDTLRIVLIDPKRSAFADLARSPFMWDDRSLVYPTLGDVEEGHPTDQPPAQIFDRLIDEMERRYKLMQPSHSKDIDEFAQKTGERLPRIVCFCDEFRDLLVMSPALRKEIEQRIGRIGQKARAAGIHLVLATQEPSRETIRGAIDANLPVRIGLQMAKSIESRMMLNQGGAENLLGNGDLLFRDIGEPVRLQSPLLSNEEAADFFHRAPASTAQ